MLVLGCQHKTGFQSHRPFPHPGAPLSIPSSRVQPPYRPAVSSQLHTTETATRKQVFQPTSLTAGAMGSFPATLTRCERHWDDRGWVCVRVWAPGGRALALPGAGTRCTMGRSTAHRSPFAREKVITESESVRAQDTLGPDAGLRTQGH